MGDKISIMLLKKLLTLLSIIFIVPSQAGVLTCAAGITYYGTCQTACNAAYATCLAASGLTAGVTGPVGWWAWLTSAPALCSAAQGAGMATCFVTAAGMCAAPAP